MAFRTFLVAVAIIGLATACAKRPAITPNSDPSLRRTSNEFSSDAATLAPFKSDAPVGDPLDGRASVDYTLKTIQLVNLSKQEWTDLEMWVNRTYVARVPRIEPGTLRTLNFTMLYDGRGNHLPTRISQPNVEVVEVYMNGTMHTVRIVLAE